MPEPSARSDRILDGARRAFARFGVRACTIDQIAKEAGVSRITVYRHVGPKAEIFRQVVLRNTRGYFIRLAERFATATTIHELVGALFDEAQRNFTDNDLYRTLLDLEPEVPMRMMTIDAAGFYEQGVPFISPHLAPYLPVGASADDATEWLIRITISMVGTAGLRLDPYKAADRSKLIAYTVAGLAMADAL